jgi:hypothetical protein
VKAIVLCFKDVDPGAGANDLVLRAEVVFCGTEAEVPGRVVTDFGPEGNGLGIAINIAQLAQYANNVEDALLARVPQLITAGKIAAGVVLARTDCLFPTYQRGA